MNGWQVVPKGLDKAMLEVALRYDIFHAIRPAGGRVAAALYQDIIAAAPTPPVVLPPLPPHPRDSWVLWDADEKRVIEDYARAALAAYGIVDRQEDAA